MPIMAIMMSITTAAKIANSAVVNRGSSGSGSGSGSAGAGPTPIAVSEYELQ